MRSFLQPLAFTISEESRKNFAKQAGCLTVLRLLRFCAREFDVASAADFHDEVAGGFVRGCLRHGHSKSVHSGMLEMCVVSEPSETVAQSEEVDSDIVASDSEAESADASSDTAPLEELSGEEFDGCEDQERELEPQGAAIRSQGLLQRRPRGGTLRRAATSSLLEDPVARAQKRVQEKLAARRQAKQEERRKKALGQCRYSVNLEAFRRATAARVAKDVEDVPPVATESCELVGTGVSEVEKGGRKAAGKATRRRRIAIAGAGPVGLWAANLIMLRHARRVQRPAAGNGAVAAKAAKASGFIRSKDAPEIVIFEQRAEEDHCSRRNVRITLDAHTAACPNQLRLLGLDC